MVHQELGKLERFDKVVLKFSKSELRTRRWTILPKVEGLDLHGLCNIGIHQQRDGHSTKKNLMVLFLCENSTVKTRCQFNCSRPVSII